MTRDFTLEKETLHTYRYAEVSVPNNGGLDVGPMCGTVYIRKEALPTKPQRIRVTIEEVSSS